VYKFKRLIIIILIGILGISFTTNANADSKESTNKQPLVLPENHINYPKNTETLLLYWPNLSYNSSKSGLIKTIIGPNGRDDTRLSSDYITNLYLQDYKEFFYIKKDSESKFDIYRMDLSTNQETKLTNLGNIVSFFHKDNTLYYYTGNFYDEPSEDNCFSINDNGDGTTIKKESCNIFKYTDDKYIYEVGSMDPRVDREFPLVRKPLDAEGDEKVEKLTKFQVDFGDFFTYNNTLVYVEYDKYNNLSYLNVAQGESKFANTIRGNVTPIAIYDQWVLFTEDSMGLYKMKPDGRDLEKIGNDDVVSSYYGGSIKGNLVFITYDFENIIMIPIYKPINFSDVDQSNWFYTDVKWAVNSGVVHSTESGKFRPNDYVTEAEFLRMMISAYDEDDGVKRPLWYDRFYEIAKQNDWELEGLHNPEAVDKPITRGNAARLVINMTGNYASQTEVYIQEMYRLGLSNGKTAKTIEGYAPNEYLTRAEAVAITRDFRNHFLKFNKKSILIKN